MIRQKAFNIIAMASHVWFGLAIVWGGLLFTSEKTTYWISGGYCVLIAIKEAFIDPIIETPEEAGSGFCDWVTNMTGAAIAWTAYFLLK